MSHSLTVMERFDAKYIPEPNSGCWIWLGQPRAQGYGGFRHEGKRKLAHRASYEIHIGLIPSGLHVLHKCDVTACVNPDHLRLGTNNDNIADKFARGRVARAPQKIVRMVRGHRPGEFSAVSPIRFENNIIPEPNSGCWLWAGREYGKGYGALSVNNRNALAHRVSYEIYKGPITGGLHVDHKCRVRCCVNPDHLRLLTLAANVLAGTGVTAVNAAKTHCGRGHEFTPDNTRRTLQGRSCRKCARTNHREARKRRGKL